jgi:hypothetical protein
VAAELRRLLGSRWNPLHCGRSDLPLRHTLIAKLMFVSVGATKGPTPFVEPFLPFLAVFEWIRPYGVFVPTLTVLWILSMVLLFFTRRGRMACLIAGTVFLVSVLASKNHFTNHATFFACSMLLLGLQPKGEEPTLLRWQIGIVYLGAALNKALQPDWWSGQFIHAWSLELGHGLYGSADAWFGDAWLLSRVTGWSVILLEAVLGVILLRGRSRVASIWLGLGMQLSMMGFVAGGPQFAYFSFIAGAALISVASWPREPVYSFDPESRPAAQIGRWIGWLDWERQIERQIEPWQGGGPEAWGRFGRLRTRGTSREGFSALQGVLLIMPATYFGVLLCLMVLGGWPRVFLAASLLVAFAPPLARIVDRRMSL